MDGKGLGSIKGTIAWLGCCQHHDLVGVLQAAVIDILFDASFLGQEGAGNH